MANVLVGGTEKESFQVVKIPCYITLVAFLLYYVDVIAEVFRDEVAKQDHKLLLVTSNEALVVALHAHDDENVVPVLVVLDQNDVNEIMQKDGTI